MIQFGKRFAVAVLVGAGLLAGCATPALKVADVYVSYETLPDAGGAGVRFGPKKVRQLRIEPDKVVLYYSDSRGEFLPVNSKLKWFKWSETPE